MGFALDPMFAGGMGGGAHAQVLFESHLEIDAAIGEQLQQVVETTEASAMGLIERLRALDQSIESLMQRLAAEGATFDGIERHLDEGASSFARVREALQRLPATVQSDLESLRGTLDGRAEALRDDGPLATHVDELRTLAAAADGFAERLDTIRNASRTLATELGSCHRALSGGIAQILAELQYQDIVRQRIGRVNFVVERRNAVLGELPRRLEAPPPDSPGASAHGDAHR